MVCLSQEQLAELALGLEGDSDADFAAHLEECALCQANLARSRALVDQLSATHNKIQSRHDESRVRLLENLPAMERPRQPVIGRKQQSSWFGGLNMKQRIALSGVSVTVVLGLLFASLVIMDNPVSAVERMRESINKAKSYKMKLTTEVQLARQPGQLPEIMISSGYRYWLASGSMRMEGKGDDRVANASATGIYPAGKPGILINHTDRTFQRVQSWRGLRSPIMLFQGLGKYSGEADRMLGTKTINGKKTLGFVIDAQEIDPDAHAGSVEVWIDAETNLPALVRVEMKNAQVPMTLRMEDFHWNVELDSKLFDPTPPKGYTDATPMPSSPEEEVRKISQALKVYAELSGGHYPRVKIIYGDVMRDEMLRMAGFTGQPTPDQLRDKKYAKITKATHGLGTLSLILRDNSDATYFGRTVGPQDKDKVLLQWKLDDGRFHVMYGDLRGETVTAEHLRALKRK